jgi:hypothetical protein
MKTVVLAVLLLLTVACIVSGAPMESDIESGDTSVDLIVSGDTTEGGKFRYGDETCPPVIYQKLQLYKIVSLCVTTSYVMTYGEMEVKLQTF